MSVARDAAGSSTTSAAWPARSSGLMPGLEEIAAHQVARARALHVRSGVDDDVPLAACGRIGDVQGRPGVRHSLAVDEDLVQGESDATAALAAPDMYVRHVDRVRLQPGDLQLDGRRTLAGGDRDLLGRRRRIDRIELEIKGLGARSGLV